MELDSLPRCMPLKAVPYLKRGGGDLTVYDAFAADLGMMTKMLPHICPVAPQVPRPALACPSWRHTRSNTRRQEACPNVEALMAAVNSRQHFLVSALHSQWLDSVSAYSKEDVVSNSDAKAKLKASRSIVVLADLADLSTVWTAQEILRIAKNMAFGMPAFVVWIRGEQAQIKNEQVLKQVQLLLSSGADDVILKCDEDVGTALEVSMLRENQKQREAIQAKEQSDKKVEEMSWQWTHMYWQWLLQFPRIDNSLEAEHQNIGDLQYVRDLGSGSFTKVHEAKSQKGESIAVKVFQKSNLNTLSRVEAMYREIYMLNKIPAHPNLVKMNEVLHTKDAVYICVDYAGPENLFQLQMRQPDQKFKLKTAQRFFSQIADGVAHLHKNTFYHGDIKPENIVVDWDMRALLIDYGSMTNTNEPLTKNKGTLPFVAPEALNVPCSFFGGPADSFSLGATLLEMVRGVNYLQTRLEMSSSTEPSPVIAEKLKALLALGAPPETSDVPEPEALTELLIGTLKIEPTQRLDLPSILHSAWIKAEQHFA